MARYESALPDSKVYLDAQPQRIHIKAPAAFSGVTGQRVCENFLRRVFTVRSVRSIDLDRVNGNVTISHAVNAEGLPELLRLLSKTIVGDESTQPYSLTFPMAGERLVLFRYGDRVTPWQVMTDRPGLLELRRLELGKNASKRRRLFSVLESMRGVKAFQSRRSSSRLVINYDPTYLNAAQILRLVDEVFQKDSWVNLQEIQRTSYGMAPATVAISAGALFVPEFAIASAVLLMGMNIPTVGKALTELSSRRFGLPVLYSTILITTLATGQFLPASLMTWFFRFWRRRFEQKLEHVQFDMLSSYLPKPVAASRRSDNGTIEAVQTDTLLVGDLILVKLGDIVPADATIVEGHCALTQFSSPGRQSDPRQKGPGDRIHAGSVLVAGQVTASVEKTGADTLAAGLGQVLVDATTPVAGTMSPTQTAELFASRAVKPTLILAGLGGLATGDLMTAGAVLRPDYATGIGLSETINHWAGVDRCLTSGAILRSPQALDKLLTIKVVIFDQSVTEKTDQRFHLVVEGGLDPGLLVSLVAGVLRHVGDPRAAAAIRECRQRGHQPLQVNFLRRTTKGYAAEFKGHEIFLDDFADMTNDTSRLSVKVDGATAGELNFTSQSSPELNETLEALRKVNPKLRFVCLSSHGSNEAANRLDRSLDSETRKIGRGTATPSGIIKGYQESMGPVAFIGDLNAQETAQIQADLMINCGESLSSSADIHLLDSNLSALPDLWSIAKRQTELSKQNMHGALGPNLLCVAGCFLLGFTSLHAVVISNLGTLALYKRATARLEASA